VRFAFHEWAYSGLRNTHIKTGSTIEGHAIPKGTNFKIISDAKIRQVEKRLHERPRKALGFRTPQEIFDEKDIDS